MSRRGVPGWSVVERQHMSVHSAGSHALPTAVVMNLYYTGLGIARSLGEQGVPVVGLAASRGVYGNSSRYVTTVRCADSRQDPEALLGQLRELGTRLGHRGVIFPTRDHDVVFLDRFRTELEPYFALVIPPAGPLERCLNKWETYRHAVEANVPTPRSWLVESTEELEACAAEVTYPCVMKPPAAHHWRTPDAWEAVGGRKAISVASREELLAEYRSIARADRRLLVQEQIPGRDDCLVVAAAYVDRQGRFQGGFNTQKLVQVPPGFGTGCIVQSVDRPELFDRTIRLLEHMGFTGVAEVEYKRDERDGEFKLIEVNPRPWDQHRLGAALGIDLMLLAYCDHAGLARPAARSSTTAWKWIADDAFLTLAMRLLWRRDPALGDLFRQARGRRIYAIWSARDPLPFLAYLTRFLPALVHMAWRAVRPHRPKRASRHHEAALRVLP